MKGERRGFKVVDEQAFRAYLYELADSGAAEEERTLRPSGLIKRLLPLMIVPPIFAAIAYVGFGHEKPWLAGMLASPALICALLYMPLLYPLMRGNWLRGREGLAAHLRERLFTGGEFDEFCAEAAEVSGPGRDPAIRQVDGYIYYFIRRNWLGDYGYARGEARAADRVLLRALLKQILAEELLRRFGGEGVEKGD